MKPARTAREAADEFARACAAYQDHPDNPQIPTGAMLAIGFLLGAGMPHTAASVTVLLRRAYPDYPIPWTER